MYIDASVPKECVDIAFSEIEAAIHNGKHTKLRGIPVYKFKGKGNDMYYVAGKKVKDTIEVYGWMNISKKPYWQCWTVDQVYVFPQCRGEGWGNLLYDTIISREGLIIASGDMQSVAGRRMWRNMVKSDRYTIWAHDFKNTQRFADVIYDDDQNKLVSKLKIYQRYGWREDIRLIAIKKAKKRK